MHVDMKQWTSALHKQSPCFCFLFLLHVNEQLNTLGSYPCDTVCIYVFVVLAQQVVHMLPAE